MHRVSTKKTYPVIEQMFYYGMIISLAFEFVKGLVYQLLDIRKMTCNLPFSELKHKRSEGGFYDDYRLQII